MKRSVVEGEPGIFPDPIARALRAFARLMTRMTKRSHNEEHDDPPATSQ